CPHRLSDKLLKSSATLLCGAGCIYYAFRFMSQALIFAKLIGSNHSEPYSTRRFVFRCAVSVEAHYREFFEADKG
ncbi:hypothetical protein RBJ15_18875, partial [Pantoea sp. BS_4]|uniref:hypothetical protein n=1 Tax=Pantoea sp. BS_4 TaxID=3055780 RepID=UPI003F7FC687